jgi:DNA polymerase III alpha subunit (gram-positive type)
MLESIKIVILDVETSGLQPWKHSVWQIAASAGMLVKSEQGVYEFQPSASFNAVCEIAHLEWHPIARKMYDEWLANNKHGLPLMHASPIDLGIAFMRWLEDDVQISSSFTSDKAYFVGYNINFDWDFLYYLFKTHLKTYVSRYAHYPPLDVAQFCACALEKERNKMKDFKLGTVAQHMNVQVDAVKQHDANYDIMLTEKCFINALNVLRHTI